MVSMTHSMPQLHVAWQFNKRFLVPSQPMLMNSEPFRWKFIGHVGRNFHIFVLISLFFVASLSSTHRFAYYRLFPAQKCTFSSFCAVFCAPIFFCKHYYDDDWKEQQEAWCMEKAIIVRELCLCARFDMESRNKPEILASWIAIIPNLNRCDISELQQIKGKLLKMCRL